MNELFHTEDCGLSLICRCCRTPVCERNLSRADRMRIHRELWPHVSTKNQVRRAGSAQQYLRKVYGRVNLGVLNRIARWAECSLTNTRRRVRPKG